MNSIKATTLTAVLLGLTLAMSVNAQQAQENFPREGTSSASCQGVEWNTKMTEQHPRLIEACQEVVDVNGESWARFDAKFRRIERDGNVVFSVQDRRDRSVEEVTLVPTSGQVAYIDNRETPFRQLRTTDAINLYVPEGQYGFSTRAGVAPEQVVAVAPRPVVTERRVAERAPRASVLPATASSLPWLALAGFLSMLGGLFLSIRRRS